MEASIITVSGVVVRPKWGASIEFPLPEQRESCVELWVLASGRRLLWARVEGADRVVRARALRQLGRRRYLEDGATLDAVELLRELGR